MKLVKEALDMLKEFEGFRSKPYRDAAGIPTIGYGTTVYPDGTLVTMDDAPITEEQGSEFLMAHATPLSSQIESFCKAKGLKLNQNQLSALVVFCYNLGAGPLVTPGRSVYEAAVKRDVKGIADALLLYDKITLVEEGKPIKKVMPGLTKRRQAERTLFMKKLK